MLDKGLIYDLLSEFSVKRTIITQRKILNLILVLNHPTRLNLVTFYVLTQWNACIGVQLSL